MKVTPEKKVSFFSKLSERFTKKSQDVKVPTSVEDLQKEVTVLKSDVVEIKADASKVTSDEAKEMVSQVAAVVVAAKSEIQTPVAVEGAVMSEEKKAEKKNPVQAFLAKLTKMVKNVMPKKTPAAAVPQAVVETPATETGKIVESVAQPAQVEIKQV